MKWLICVKLNDGYQIIDESEYYKQAEYKVQQLTLLDELRMENFNYKKLYTYIIVRNSKDWRTIYGLGDKI